MNASALQLLLAVLGGWLERQDQIDDLWFGKSVAQVSTMEPGRMTPCLLVFGVIGAVMTLQASEPPTSISEEVPVHSFLSTDSEPWREYRAFRRLEASNAKYNKQRGWRRGPRLMRRVFGMTSSVKAAPRTSSTGC